MKFETYLVIYVGDVHAVEDVVVKVILHHPPQNIKGNVRPENIVPLIQMNKNLNIKVNF